jgi:hypothetical protein
LATLGKTPAAYLTLFAVSSTARAITLVGLARVPRYSLDARPIATRTLGVRATDGSLDQPILAASGRQK